MPEVQIVKTLAPHSVEISRNASGGVAIAVKCYGETPEDAFAKSAQMFADLDAKYPLKDKK